MARKSGPRKLKTDPTTDPRTNPTTDPVRIAARATRRRRTPAADEKPSPVVEAEIVDPQIIEPQIVEPQIVDDDRPAAVPLADLAEAGELPEGFARARAGEAAGESDVQTVQEVVVEAAEESGGSDGGALVPFDPLGRYLTEIRRFPLLNREEEIEIAKRYAKHHDPADAYRLVTANLRLVVEIASEFAHASSRTRSTLSRRATSA